MRYDQLEHAIRAACDISGDTELLIFGSQSILGTYPEAPESLRASIEVDVQSKNRPEMTDFIDGALGQDSQFHATHGFYVHGISIEAATLPDGWLERTIDVSHPVGTKGNTGLCLEAHDLAASKLAAYREKDRVFVATLLSEGLIDGGILLGRVRSLPIEDDHRNRLVRWVEVTVADITRED
ncbi:MAG: DUF6036 family nucleotidyltransferase [Coriobacteriia bacterium]|nr:DUF6036 family nucleotidyltransferase [Coriobacteriia bacterium]